MKIVIDIPDEYAEQFYKNKCKGKFDSLATNEFGYVLRKAFEDATPLPEHHGRLIDYECVVDAIDDWINTEEYSYTNATDYLRNRVKDVPTIIERSDSE